MHVLKHMTATNKNVNLPHRQDKIELPIIDFEYWVNAYLLANTGLSINYSLAPLQPRHCPPLNQPITTLPHVAIDPLLLSANHSSHPPLAALSVLILRASRYIYQFSHLRFFFS